MTRDVVRLLAAHGISGVPVLDANRRVLGIVTEVDLLRKQARAGGAGGSVFQQWRQKAIARQDKAHTAADLMTTPVVTVAPETTLTAAAATLARHDIRQAPVVRADGTLAGIFSRKDVLSVYRRDDADLAAEIRTEVLEHAISPVPCEVSVEVVDGTVALRGKVERQSMVEVIAALTAAVDGVVDVRAQLAVEVDDIQMSLENSGTAARRGKR